MNFTVKDSNGKLNEKNVSDLFKNAKKLIWVRPFATISSEICSATKLVSSSERPVLLPSRNIHRSDQKTGEKALFPCGRLEFPERKIGMPYKLRGPNDTRVPFG